MERQRQSVATGGNVFRLSEPFPAPSHLPPVATAGLHKGSIVGCQLWRRQDRESNAPVRTRSVNNPPLAGMWGPAERRRRRKEEALFLHREPGTLLALLTPPVGRDAARLEDRQGRGHKQK